MAAPVLWPTLLGLGVLIVGIFTYRRDLQPPTLHNGFGLVVLGPVFVAASLAAFAGEHFTAATSLGQLVPKWLPARVFIAYFVGVAHLAAALSFVARRCVRWSSILLAVMFALFVLLMDLPSAITHPTVRMAWSLAARETTFAIGALALFGTVMSDPRPGLSKTIAQVARFWAAFVLVFYGIEHFLHPEFSPGVPDSTVTASWVPAPLAIAYATGGILVVLGLAMLAKEYAAAAAALCGLLMLVLTLGLYVPQFFLARDVAQHVTALNFVFDTLLFAGMMLVVSRGIGEPLHDGA